MSWVAIAPLPMLSAACSYGRFQLGCLAAQLINQVQLVNLVDDL